VEQETEIGLTLGRYFSSFRWVYRFTQ